MIWTPERPPGPPVGRSTGTEPKERDPEPREVEP